MAGAATITGSLLSLCTPSLSLIHLLFLLTFLSLYLSLAPFSRRSLLPPLLGKRRRPRKKKEVLIIKKKNTELEMEETLVSVV